MYLTQLNLLESEHEYQKKKKKKKKLEERDKL